LFCQQKKCGLRQIFFCPIERLLEQIGFGLLAHHFVAHALEGGRRGRGRRGGLRVDRLVQRAGAAVLRDQKIAMRARLVQLRRMKLE